MKTNEINEHFLLENCIYHTSNICELWCATNMRQQAGIIDMYHLSGRNRNNGEGKIKWMNNIDKHMKYKGGAYAGNKYGDALTIRWKKSLEKTHTKISYSLSIPVLIFE